MDFVFRLRLRGYAARPDNVLILRLVVRRLRVVYFRLVFLFVFVAPRNRFILRPHALASLEPFFK